MTNQHEGDRSSSQLGIFVPRLNGDTEDVIASDLKALSFQERQAITDEIHGVGDSEVEETVERVEEALRVLREEYLMVNNTTTTTINTTTSSATNPLPSPGGSLDDIASKKRVLLLGKRQAYDRAVFLRPMLERDDKLHLMFLRAQRFDPCKAAQLYSSTLKIKGPYLGMNYCHIR